MLPIAITNFEPLLNYFHNPEVLRIFSAPLQRKNVVNEFS